MKNIFSLKKSTFVLNYNSTLKLAYLRKEIPLTNFKYFTICDNKKSKLSIEKKKKTLFKF